MLYTREQIKELENIGQTIRHFHTVTESGFKRGTLIREDNAVADIYEQATGLKVARQFSCKSCNYSFYKRAAELYFESKKFYEEEDKKAEDEIVELVTGLHDLETKKGKTAPKTTAKKKTAKKK